MIAPIIGARQVCVTATLVLMIGPLILPHAGAGDPEPNLVDKPGTSWPMFGGSPSRNMVNASARNIPADWCVEEGKRKNVKWVAELGRRTMGSPVVARGKVYLATNTAKPRDPKVKGPKAVLMAFRESDGQFLWQITHDLSEDGDPAECPSTPAVVGRQLFYITPLCEVICADADNGTIHWRYDMMKELQVHPYRPYCLCLAPLSSPLVIGNLVFAATGNGREGAEFNFRLPTKASPKPSSTFTAGRLASPKAPSFIALDKRTGKLIWQSNLPGENIIEGQWSSPTFTDHGGRPQVIFAGGDGVIYSFAPETGQLLWKCDCLPTRAKKGPKEKIDNQFVATPVVLGDKIYVGLGLAPEHPWGQRWSYFLCLDITKKGDVSLKSYDAKAPLNKDSALVWAFGGPIEPRPEKGREVFFGRTLSTAAVHQGLVYIPEENGYLHCLDAATGKRFWEYDLEVGVLGSPFWVDGRVFLGTDGGGVFIFAHGGTTHFLARIEMDEMIFTTPVAVNGTLYIATQSKLYAIGSR